MFYSGATGLGGFYSVKVHGGNIPADAVEITDKEYADLLQGQAQGLRIICSPDGRPVLAAQALPTREELEGAAISERDQRLAIAALRIAPLQDAVDEGVASESKRSFLTAWKLYRIALSDIQEQSGYPDSIDWPEMPSP
ncbi:tail fiber assembly protein [Pseudomonas sp. NFXW11]|uniref:tail fiber assembly protein n=1 Tax=Pseudomonas sp. NFXW11 TaxID=2819531 RepID=UPI003CE8FC03